MSAPARRSAPGLVRDTDPHQTIIRAYIIYGNSLGFFVAFGLIWLGLGKTVLASLGYALFILLITDIPLFLAFQGVRNAANGLFGLGRPVNQEELKYTDLRDLAEANARREEYNEAARLYKQLAAHPLNPNPEYATFKLAEIYQTRLARPQDALYWYRKTSGLIRQKSAENSQAHPLAAELERALAVMGASRAQDDADQQNLLAETTAAVESGNFEEAQIICRDLLRRYPECADGWYWSGIIESKTGRPALAADRYREALVHDPLHLRALHNLGATLYRIDHWVEARETWKRYVELAKGDAAESEFLTQVERLLERINEELDSEAHLKA